MTKDKTKQSTYEIFSTNCRF